MPISAKTKPAPGVHRKRACCLPYRRHPVQSGVNKLLSTCAEDFDQIGGKLPMARFDVETTNVIAIAFDRACKALGDPPPEIIRDIVARQMFKAAETTERDPDKLCAHALRALEGYRKATAGEQI
jgi:hypothetical protein